MRKRGGTRALTAENRVGGPRSRSGELRRGDGNDSAADAGLFEDCFCKPCPRALAVRGQVPDSARRGRRDPPWRRPGGRCRWGNRAGPRRHAPRLAPRPAGASSAGSSYRSGQRARTYGRSTRPLPRPPLRAASSGRRPTAGSQRPTRRRAALCVRRRHSRSRSRRWRAERGDVRGATDVDCRSSLGIFLGPVDIGPGRRVERQVWDREARGRRKGHVPICIVERDHVVGGERLTERGAELASGARDQDASTASRAESVGLSVLHRCLTRGSSQGMFVLVRIRGVVLLGDVVTEEEIAQRLEPMSVVPGDVEATGFSSPMSSVKTSPCSRSRTTTRALPVKTGEEVVLAALVVVKPPDDAAAREGDVRLHGRLRQEALAPDLANQPRSSAR